MSEQEKEEGCVVMKKKNKVLNHSIHKNCSGKTCSYCLRTLWRKQQKDFPIEESDHSDTDIQTYPSVNTSGED